jgi:hypothetical protein
MCPEAPIQSRTRLNGIATSLGCSAMLLLLLHRALAPASVPPDILFLGALRDADALDSVYLATVATACVWAVWRGKASALTSIQWRALGLGLLLTLYRLGTPVGEKFDPRFWLALLAGIMSLYSTYLCLLAHGAIAVLRRARPSRCGISSLR